MSIENTGGGEGTSTESSVSDVTESGSEPQLESNEDGEGQGNPAVAQAAQKKVEKQLRKYKLKVDGEEYEDEIDLSNEEEVKKRLQLARVSQKRMQETATERKRRVDFEAAAENFVQTLKTNPKAILRDPNIGVDLKKLAQEILAEEAEEAQKSPEQRKIEELQRELEAREKKAKDAEEGQKKEAFARMQKEAEVRYESDITDALTEYNLPKKPYVLKKFADLMMVALENNIELTAKDVAPLVKKQMIEDIQELTGAASDDVVEELWGKELINRMRKRSLAKAKLVPGAGSVKQTVEGSKSSKPKEEKKINMRDFFKL